jgi:hypothetical protein
MLQYDTNDMREACISRLARIRIRLPSLDSPSMAVRLFPELLPNYAQRKQCHAPEAFAFCSFF